MQLQLFPLSVLIRLSVYGLPICGLHSGQIVEIISQGARGHSFLGPNADAIAFRYKSCLVDRRRSKEAYSPRFEHLMRELTRNGPIGASFTQFPDLDYIKRAYPLWARFEGREVRLDPGREPFLSFPRSTCDPGWTPDLDVY